MPTVSIIMGVYNCNKPDLLEKSICSIIDQTYKDWEFIICNDGSTDGKTLNLLKSYEKKDDRIIVLSYDKNQGLCVALNACLKIAKGKYIARQDDDDISATIRIEKQFQFLESHLEYAMVGSIARVFDEGGSWGHYRVPEKPEKQDFFMNSPFIHPSIMFRKKILDSVGGYRVSKETRRCEDFDLFMRLYAKGLKGFNIQEELYQYNYKRNDKQKHRSMKYRVDEAIVRWKGYKQMHVLSRGWYFVFKPIIAGLIPASLFSKIQNRQYY